MAIIRSIPTERLVNGYPIKSSQRAIVSDSQFRTSGEEYVVIKSVNSCKVMLDHTTTDKVKIKALTKVLILPTSGRIDEEFDEIALDKGACVEFVFLTNNWYIMSSDGIKLD